MPNHPHQKESSPSQTHTGFRQFNNLKTHYESVQYVVHAFDQPRALMVCPVASNSRSRVNIDGFVEV